MRQRHRLDANGKAPGRLATEISRLLMGKHKPDYVPNVDAGDFVDVENAAFMRFTGKKLEQKKYMHHSGYLGGIKAEPAKKMMRERPAEVLRRAVSRMLPKNTHRTERLKRLIIK